MTCPHFPVNDLGQALNASGQALFLAEHSASRRIRMRLSELHDQLGAHRMDPDASDTLHQLRELLGKRRRK
jgi:hypothetical protein